MELTQIREYHPEGTNSTLQDEEGLVCYTIELPWLENLRSVSCIPEGRYKLVKRCTKKRGAHVMVEDVPGRSGILIHPANYAIEELRGCIAPVTTLTGPGRGIHSRSATERLQATVFAAFERKEEVYLTIRSNKK